MKKFLVTILALIMIISLGACGSGTKPSKLNSSGYPVKYEKQREKALAALKGTSEENKHYVYSSKGALTETNPKDADFIYYGDLKSNRANGYGVVVNRSGSVVFVGEFKKGKTAGYGIVLDADDYNNHPYKYEADDCDFISIGGLQRFRASGEGFIYHHYSNLREDNFSIIYQGELKKNERSGYGIAYKAQLPLNQGYGSLLYEGEFKDDQYSGKGKIYYAQGQLEYEGEFKKGKANGKGTLYNPDGSVKHKGKFKDNKII